MVQRETDSMTTEKEPPSTVCMPNKKEAKLPDASLSNNRPDTFEEFSSYTTLHGVRFIGDQSFVLPRRLIWLCIVLLSGSIFTYQVIDRIQYYLKSPINVNFKVNYNKSLKFPAITICNQNVFKLSRAYLSNLQDTIGSMYGDEAVQNLSSFIPDLPIDILYKELAHEKEDLIISCYFGPDKCYPENFTTTLTSHGVCYTFNKVDSIDDALIINISGVDHGLRLVLNTESYEKNVGPHDIDGIKLIATDQSEMPSVDEIGIAMSAGTHAFVGLGVLSLNNLEPPYGQCGSLDLLTTKRYTFDSCMLECKTRLIIRYCGCRDFYMPDIHGNKSICTVEEYLYCLHFALEIFNENKDELCDCPTACMYSIYEPTVSYAKKTDWESLFDDDNTGYLERLTRRFITSKEVGSRTEDEKLRLLERKLVISLRDLFALDISSRGLDTFAKFIKSDIDELFNETNEATVLRNNLYDIQLFIVENNFKGGFDSMEEKSFGVVCQDVDEFLFQFSEKTMGLLKDKTDDINSKILTLLVIRDSILKKSHTLEKVRETFTKLIDAYSNGKPILKHRYELTNDTVMNVKVPKQLLNESLYKTHIIHDSLLRLDDIDNISEILSKVTKVSLNLYYSLYYNDTEMFNVENITSIEIAFTEACDNFLSRKRIFHSEIIKRPSQILNQRKDTLVILKDSYIKEYESVIRHMADMWEASDDAQLTILKVNEMISEGLNYTKNSQQATITKLDIAKKLSSDDMSNNLRELDLHMANIKERLDEMTESVSMYFNSINDTWAHLLEFPGDNNPNDRYFEYTKLTQSFNERVQAINDIKDPILTMLDIWGKNIEDGTQKLKKNIARVTRSMERYVESADVDYNKNFLEVDIYFKELRSETIDQQKAYDGFSLLCDIGGSMGLFIGGSAITFFEVIDFLVLCFVHKVIIRKP